VGAFAAYGYLLNRADKWLVVQGRRAGGDLETFYFHLGFLGQAMGRSRRETEELARLLGSAEQAHPADGPDVVG
jgi:hypothetical protein